MTEQQIFLTALLGATIVTIGLLCSLIFILIREVQKLVDKLMSRDYHSYASSNKQVGSRVKKVEIEPPLENFDRIIG